MSPETVLGSENGMQTKKLRRGRRIPFGATLWRKIADSRSKGRVLSVQKAVYD
ncbi:hypothetical protein SAMN04488498_110150 [Mesorhizobium albiziae]|uniref:Uncharacterized protein n=1 Tax=Neomesorhizobium albiziae TaxID=335020 RepID=A0A1I4BJH5_9HYPH|nr:hypothetical protein [Mesorhizobium albiziae]SFK68066.1 hypothetical protein SAMN04488498_110150 [Mesorhizobium albiziae]